MSPKTVTVHSSLLFDPKQKAFLKDVSIRVDCDNGSILAVYERSAHDEINAADIDLRGKVVMPGLVDAHTHIFLHSYDERPAPSQMRDESPVERIVRATTHLRHALLAGYTTLRDLGSEAMGAHDAALRNCVNRGLTPGPRLFVATDALSSTGGYAPRSENPGTATPVAAADEADGVEGVRRAVRRRVAAGADVVKFYADYRRKTMRFPPGVRFPPAQPDPAVLLFAPAEMEAIVAAHATTARGGMVAVKAGITTLEHGFGAEEEVFREMVRRGCVYVPTLAAAENLAGERFPDILAGVKRAFDLGVRLAAGGDTGTFPHGQGAREVELMVQAGIPVEEALESCMVGGWEACGKDLCGFRFGWFDKGNRADIIALDTDPREDETALRKVDFVMKDGHVWKRDGRAVVMADGHAWTDTWTHV